MERVNRDESIVGFENESLLMAFLFVYLADFAEGYKA